MKRTKMLVTMQPASTTAVTSTLRVISSTRNDIVSGPPTIATARVAIPVSMVSSVARDAVPDHRDDGRKEFSEQAADEQRSDEQAAAKTRRQRDEAGHQLQRDHG